MFPFVLDRLDDFLREHSGEEVVVAACNQIAVESGKESLADWQRATGESAQSLIATEVRRLMANDVKATGLKALQGLIWQGGFESGQLVAHVYPDVIPAIKQWRAEGYDVRIYSSGSIAAQRLFFGHLAGFGDCLDLFSGHYDTTIGGKKESESYTRVAADWNLQPSEIVFVSDVADELKAAKLAGLHVIASVRPGNQPLPSNLDMPRIVSFADISIQS